MACDLIHGISPAELKARLEPLIAANEQPLPPSAKQFLAVARLQGFDARPENVDPAQMDALIAGGYIEMDRGLVPSAGQPATFFANQLFFGPMYPGGVVVYGHGIYTAEPSHPNTINPLFPRISKVAVRYATRGQVTGAVLRGALRPDARIMDVDALKECYREDKNRVHKAGLSDLGTYAAALGIDAISVDEHFTYCTERTWNVVNRTALTLQNRGLRIFEKVDNVPSGTIHLEAP